jgi:hypothetical protein
MQENEIMPENEEQADELLSQIEEPSGNAVEAAPAPAPVDEFSFTVGGKEIKANREKIIKWAQMGYDAPTRIGALSKEVETYKQQQARLQSEYEAKYGEIDKFVRQDPKGQDFWKHVQESWQKRDQLINDQTNPLASTVNELKQQVSELFQYKTQIEQQQQQVHAAREDEAYMKESGSIRAKYPQIDFDTPDETGKSLEYKVLEYATQNGITKFTTAFRDFYHDELVKISAEQAKESVAKDKQKNTKLGILGITNAPTKRSSDDVKGKSYNDLVREALEENGI